MSESLLQGSVVAVEGDRVTLTLADGQKLIVPLAECEGTPTVGASVRLIVAVLGTEDAGRQALARDLLNELLRHE